MAGYFDEAFLPLESFLDRNTDDELQYDADELLNFATDSEEEGTTGSCHVAPSLVGGNRGTVEEVAFRNADASDVTSSDGDGLYNERTPNSIGDFDEEASGGANVAAAEDKARSWRINHSSGDHKLRRRLGLLQVN